jgi:putative membrane protein
MSELKPAQHFAQTTLSEPELPKLSQQFSAQPLLADDTTLSASVAAPRSRMMPVALLALGLLLVLAVWQWLEWLQQSWQQGWFSGALVSAFSVLVAGLLAGVAWREWRLWRRLQRNQQWQQQAERIRNTVQYGEAMALCEAILAAMPQTPQHATATEDWRKAVQPEHSDAEVLALFEQYVMRDCDKQAQQIIWRAGTDSSLAVAVSPFALADMLLVVWRSSRMLRQLALLYGAPVGQLRSLALLKRALAALLWAGGSELALDLAADVLSSELTAKLSARAGQGVVAGLLVARLGTLAQQQLRPLPLQQGVKIQPGQLAAALVKRFKPAEAVANKN